MPDALREMIAVRASREVIDRVLEHLSAEAITGQAEACPVGMLGSEEEAFGMRHQAEDSSGRVAQPGDVGGRAVGVRGVTRVVGMGRRAADG